MKFAGYCYTVFLSRNQTGKYYKIGVYRFRTELNPKALRFRQGNSFEV